MKGLNLLSLVLALARERLEESACRILSLKAAYGVDDAPVEAPDVEGLSGKIRAVLP